VARVPKVSSAHLAARRQQILAGAQRAFARWGYEGATVARLEEETGLSRGAIFHYFDSKLDLFVQLSAEENRRYLHALMERGVDAMVRQMAAESREWLGVMIEAQTRLRHDEEFLRRMEARDDGTDRARVLAWLRARQADGTFRADIEPEDLARFMTMVVNGLALRVVGGDETNVEPLLRLLNDALVPRQ
jgi:AcrR family transcriptional regulator